MTDRAKLCAIERTVSESGSNVDSGAQTNAAPRVRAVAAPCARGVVATDAESTACGGSQSSQVKRVMDVAGSLALLVVGAPLLVVTAAAVKATSRGPVFFRQERLGRHGVPFTLYKFRTMQAQATDTIHREFVRAFITDTAVGPPAGGIHKILNDPRLTPIGGWLRRSCIDELPQLWNVLRGDMSLVGPRPPLHYEVEHYAPRHRARLSALPGITGLWQVSGRSRTTFEQMVRLDLAYIRRQSWRLDVKILLLTPFAIVSGGSTPPLSVMETDASTPVAAAEAKTRATRRWRFPWRSWAHRGSRLSALA